MITCTCGYRGAGIADGSTLVCPICRTPAAASSPPAPAAPMPPVASPPAPMVPSPSAPPSGLRMPPPPGARPAPAAAPAPGAGGPLGPVPANRESGGIVRIPCPNGHVLKTKRSRLGQQVVCPTCNEFFVLEETDSLEYKQEAARRRAREDEERAQKWLWRAIYAAIFIVLSFIVMAVIGSNPQWFR